jgi:hypothetical protein
MAYAKMAFFINPLDSCGDYFHLFHIGILRQARQAGLSRAASLTQQFDNLLFFIQTFSLNRENDPVGTIVAQGKIVSRKPGAGIQTVVHRFFFWKMTWHHLYRRDRLSKGVCPIRPVEGCP